MALTDARIPLRWPRPSYGKRSAPDQNPRSKGDFVQLPEPEALIAAYIVRLPDGAAIDTKRLAKVQPRYGQQAVRSALNAISAAGHLRRPKETTAEGRTR